MEYPDAAQAAGDVAKGAVPAIISESLPGLIDRASRALASAGSSAEVLEARDLARGAYDAAKSAGRIIKAKHAHAEVIEAVHRAQADALLIETFAKARLADAYDAAQAAGEVSKGGPRPSVPDGNVSSKPIAAEIGLSRKDIHEARQLRDAEKAQPGVTEAALQAAIKAHREPTRAELRASVLYALSPEGSRAARRERQTRPGWQRSTRAAPDPLFDAVSRFIGHCQGISETPDLAEIAAYSSPVFFATRDEMLARAAEALTILQQFEAALQREAER